MAEKLKITYATLSDSNEEIHSGYEAGLTEARTLLGGSYGNFVNGAWTTGGATFEKHTPIDGSLVGTFAKGDRTTAKAAIAAAKAAYPAWSARSWKERVALIRAAAELISDRQFVYSALLSIEVGKNRLEALGDVEETADFFRIYASEVERNDGYTHVMGNLGDAKVQTKTILKPYGVWAVISPFNFPFALMGGPVGGAMVAGNTVVLKPSSDAPLSAVLLARALKDAGIPDGVFNMVMGPGDSVGAELQENHDVAGITFTGSSEVGMQVYRSFAKNYPKPVIVEMGGKNPTIISKHADIEKAAEGVMRSAFGLGGQKCSANSRVYVEASVHDAFVAALVEKTKALKVGDPTVRGVFLGPIINQRSVDTFLKACDEAKRDGTIVVGGTRLMDGELSKGFYVAPTIVTGLPATHRLFRDELFVPFVVVTKVGSFEEGIALANESDYALTAGCFTEDEAEIRTFLDTIDGGVIYVNRRAGSTTGAWPMVQPFGGWKKSGTTGKSGGGLYYVPQYLREQSQTIVR
jgi:1-pyrroline-5-carboxylate dehydrogenase